MQEQYGNPLAQKKKAQTFEEHKSSQVTIGSDLGVTAIAFGGDINQLRIDGPNLTMVQEQTKDLLEVLQANQRMLQDFNKQLKVEKIDQERRGSSSINTELQRLSTVSKQKNM